MKTSEELPAAVVAGRPPVRDEIAAPVPSAVPDYGVAVRFHTCDGCGSWFAVAKPEGRSQTRSPLFALEADAEPGRCPLCGASPRAPGPDDRVPGTGPARTAPFAIPPARATALFHRWLSRLRLRPLAWRRLARARGLGGVYLPLWVADATLRSRWSAEVTTGPSPAPSASGTSAPRRWEPASGERIDRIEEAWPAIGVVAESPLLPSLLDPANLVPWTADHLASSAAVIHPGTPEDAWHERREALFERARERCAADVPGVDHHSLQVDTEVELADVAPVLVPAYVAAVPWRGRVYRFVVDGRTGQADGEAPYSPGKLVGLIAAAVVAVAAMGAVLANEPPAAAAPPAVPAASP